VAEEIVRSKMDEVDVFAGKLYLALGRAAQESVGNMLGHLLQETAMTFISKSGLSCFDVPMKSEADPVAFTIQPGLKSKIVRPTKDFRWIVDECTDVKVAYFFGSNQPGFDIYIPPNNFINVANSIKKDRLARHPLLLDVMVACCELMKEKGMDMHMIVAVGKSDWHRWRNARSFKVNVDSVVDDINAKLREVKKDPSGKTKRVPGKKSKPLCVEEETSAEGQEEFKLNGERTLAGLPSVTQSKLGNFKQYLGLISTSKRSFSTLSIAPHPRCSKPVAFNTCTGLQRKFVAFLGNLARMI